MKGIPLLHPSAALKSPILKRFNEIVFKPIAKCVLIPLGLIESSAADAGIKEISASEMVLVTLDFRPLYFADQKILKI